ncbi:unnamed protein product [Closterium sp. NIES-53]
MRFAVSSLASSRRTTHPLSDGGAGRGAAAHRGGASGSQRQQQPRSSETPSVQQLREWYAGRGRSGGAGPCAYVLHTGPRSGEVCGLPHTTQRCFGRLIDAWRTQFPDAVELPRLHDLLLQNVPIFDLHFDAILAAMYALADITEGDCYLSVSPDPGTVAAALGASASAAPGAGTSPPSGTAPTEALHTFTLDSGASRSFFRDSTTLTPLSRPGAVSIADPSGGPDLARSSTVLPCPAAPSGLLSGLHLPSFSTNLVSGADLQDAWIDQFTPGGQRVATSSQVFAAASRSSPASAPCSCHPLSHETNLWHHRLGHPSLPRLQGMASRALVSGLPIKGEVPEVLIDWIRSARRHLSESFGSDLPVLGLHSDRGGEFSSDLLRAFCHSESIRQTFTLPASPQKNGIAERRIGMVMDVARTSMIHAAAPHFLWPFAVQYAAHQINLQPRVSLPETTPTLRWTGKVGDASAFRVWGSRAFVRDTTADKLSSRAVPCVFLGFPPDAPGWQFYHPTSRRVLSSQDVTFDESVSYYRLFPYRTASPSPPPLFLAPVTPPVDPLPPQGPAPSGVSQVDPAKPVEVAVDSGAESGGAEPAGAGTGSAGSGGAESGRAEPGGTEPGRVEPEGVVSGGAEPACAASGASGGAAGTGAAGGAAGAGGATGGAAGAGGATRGAAGAGGAAGASGGVAGAGAAGGAAGAGSAAGTAASGAGVSGASGTGDPMAEGTDSVSAVSGGAVRLRPYYVPLIQQVLGSQPSPGPPPPSLSPLPVPSQTQLQPASPLPGPSPYSGPTGGLTKRREPESRPVLPVSRSTSPVRYVRAVRVSRPRPPPVPGTHSMTLRPSTAPQRVPLPSPPASSLPDGPDPASDSLRAASPTFTRFLATAVTDPLFESSAVSALVAKLVDFAAACHLDYATSLVISLRLCLSVLRPSGVSALLARTVKRPLGSPPVFKARYVARGFSQRQGVGFFQTFSPTPKMTTLRVLLYVAAQLDYELHSLDFSIAFLQGSLHEEIWLRRPPSFTGPYPELVGCLMYLMTCTRPDLAYPLSLLARYYIGHGLVLGGRARVVLFGQVDASWVDDLATQRSSQGYTFSLGSGSVSWRSTHSSSVLSFSCEAEIYAGAMAAQKLRWLTYLLTDLGEAPRSPPVLYVDNKAMLALCQEHILEHRTKHIALRYFLARELQQRGQLRLAYVASQANTADVFTKALQPCDHQHFCIVLGLVPTMPHLLTS